MKQVLRVLAAVDAGADCSRAVAAISGLPTKHCSAWLRALEAAGLVERTGRTLRFPVESSRRPWTSCVQYRRAGRRP